VRKNAICDFRENLATHLDFLRDPLAGRDPQVENHCFKASFEVTLQIVQCKKPPTIAEELILPGAVDMVIGEGSFS